MTKILQGWNNYTTQHPTDDTKDYPPYLDYPKERKPMTNGDLYRAMTDEELAKKFSEKGSRCPNNGFHNCWDSCEKCWLDWLKQEVQDVTPD